MQWITPTSTRNYMLKDPLCDWLDRYATNLSKEKPDISDIVSHISNSGKSEGFLSFLLNQGNNFEKEVIKIIEKKFGSKFVDISKWESSKNVERPLESRFLQTINAMKKGTPFIYQGVLIDAEEHIRGIPDLIVRSDYLDQLVTMKYLTDADRLRSCSLTKKKYHYRIVDIKFTTLLLRSTGINLLNSGSVPAFKSQVWLYTKMLGKVQGYTPDQAYILGRRWKYTCKDQCFQGSSCFDRLGVVDFTLFDKPVVEKTQKAIEWLRLLEREGSTWSILTVPLKHKELYPNMSNNHDAPWRPIKEIIAKQIKEITALWMCGPKNRQIAHDFGIFQWSDPKCTTEILGVNGQKTSRILKEILETNKGPHIFNVRPRIIDIEYQNWDSIENVVEFFIDFETINDVFDGFSELPNQKSYNYIVMLGVGKVNSEGRWTYRNFCVDRINAEEELRVCKELSQFVLKTAKEENKKLIRLVHWSNAETLSWERASSHSPIEDIGTFLMDNQDGIKVDFFDLLDLFKTVPITIRGCLNFGLKTIAKRLFELGHIKTTWPTGISSTDGVSAMLSTYNAYKDCQKTGKKLSEHNLIKEEIKYNEVDCKVLQEIIKYLRDHHSPRLLELDMVDIERVDSDDMLTDARESQGSQEHGYNLRHKRKLNVKEILDKGNSSKKQKLDKYNESSNINGNINREQINNRFDEDYFERDYRPLSEELHTHLPEVNPEKINNILKNLGETLNSEYLGAKPSDKAWKIGLPADKVNSLDVTLKAIRKEIYDETPSMAKILEANISSDNKKLAIELFDIWSNMEPYTEKYLEMKVRINKILLETVNDQEEKIKIILKDYSSQISVKMRICNLNADDLTKATLYQMYDRMLQYTSGSTEYVTIHRKISIALQLPYRNIKKIEYGAGGISEFLSSVKQKLDEKIYKMEGVKEELLAALNGRLLNIKSKAMLALKGIAGVGKSHLVEVFARAVGLPFERVNLGGSEDPSVFKGNNTVWEGSTPSIILQILIKLKCSNGIIFFDEIDKLGNSEKGRAVQYALLHITDYTQNHNWADDFLPEISHDLSNLWFMFAMNDDQQLDRTLRDRLHIVIVPSYDAKSIYFISRDYVLPRILNDVGMQKGDIILTEDGFNTLDKICHCVKSEGVRSLERVCRTLVNRVRLLISVKESAMYDSLSFALSKKPNLPIKMNGNTVKSLLSQLEILS